MKKYLRVFGEELFQSIILCNDNDVTLRDMDEAQMLTEMCQPHLEEYEWREVCVDTIKSTDPMVNPFNSNTEKQMHIVSIERLMNWPQVLVKACTAKEVQTIGAFNRIWNAIDTYGLM